MIELTKENVLMNIIQEIKDLVYGGLTHRNMKTIRTAYVVCSEDSLDADHPMLVPFTMPAGTTKIVQVRVNFFIKPFRAYSKTVQSSPQLTANQNETTTTGSSSITTTLSGGSVDSEYTSAPTTSVASGYPARWVGISGYTVPDYESEATELWILSRTGASNLNSHRHIVRVTIGAHSHGMNHTHEFPHQHTINPHSHDIDFGIHEHSGSPTIAFSVSKDNGGLYIPVGSYTQNQLHVEITSLVDYRSVNILKFESTTLTRISTQIEIKVDMSR